MAPWAAVLGEEGISHLLNELIRAQRFHFEEAAGLSLISVALDLRRSGGEGAISNTCSPGDFTAGKWLGLTSLPAQATAPLSRAELKMNGANCSSSCHISRAETKPLLTQETMSLCKSQQPTETSPQPHTMQWARVHPALPTSHCHRTPGRPWDGPPLAAAHLPGQLWVSQPCQVPPLTLGAPRAVMDPAAIALPGMALYGSGSATPEFLWLVGGSVQFPACRGTGKGWSCTPSLGVAVRRAQSIPPPPAWNNSQEDEKCHKLFTHKRDEKGEDGEEESL